MTNYEILKETFDKGLTMDLNKYEGDEILKQKQYLKAIGLLEQSGKSSLKLSADGYKVIELGSLEKWQEYNENKYNPVVNNVGNNYGNLNQGFILDNSSETSFKQTIPPIEKEIKKNPIIAIIKKYYWGLLIPLLIGFILLAFDKGWIKF